MGGEFQGEQIYVYVWLSAKTVTMLLIVVAINYIPAIFQYKIKSFFKKKTVISIPSPISFFFFFLFLQERKLLATKRYPGLKA